MEGLGDPRGIATVRRARDHVRATPGYSSKAWETIAHLELALAFLARPRPSET
jgi:hypothetical protein